MISNTVTSSTKLSSEIHSLEKAIGRSEAFQNGVVSGMVVSVSGMVISITAGEVFVAGSYFEFPGLDSLSYTTSVGYRGFVVARKIRSVTKAEDDFHLERETGTRLDLQVLSVDWYQDGDVVLASIEVLEHYREDESGDVSFVTSNPVALEVEVPTVGPFTVDLKLHNVSVALMRNIATGDIYTYAPVDPVEKQYSITRTANTSALFFSPKEAGNKVAVTFTYEIPRSSVEVAVISKHASFTATDHDHVSGSVAATVDEQNIHGTSFRDISFGMPLHSKLLDRGFATYPNTSIENLPGVFTSGIYKPYKYVVNAVEFYRYDVDWFGYDTGIVGSQYIRLKHIPLRVAYVIDATTRRPLNFNHNGNCVYFDSPTILSAVPVEIGYTYIPDFEPRAVGTSIQIEAQVDSSKVVAVSSGLEVIAGSQPIFQDFGKYRGVPANIVVALDSDGAVALSPSIIDTAKLSTKRSSTFTTAKPVNSQIALTLRNSPLVNALKPPGGFLKLTTALDKFYGRRRFFYTYSKKATILYVTQDPVIDIPAGHNLDGAVVYRNDEVLDRASWEFVTTDRHQIVIANDVFEEIPNSTFRLAVNDFTSARNRRGYFEVVGTAAAPIGPNAKCTVTSQQDKFEDGDTFQISTIDGTYRKVYRLPGSTWKGSTNNLLAISVVDCFSQDPLFQALGISATYADSVVTFNTSLQEASLSVALSNTNVRVQQFDNGTAGVEFLNASNFKDGDSITISVGSNPPIVKYFASEAIFTDTSTNVHRTLADAFSALELRGFVFTPFTDNLEITSGDFGVKGNTNTFSAPYWFKVSGFSGGADTQAPGFADIDGSAFLLIDEQELDVTGEFTLYSTDNLDEGADEDSYREVAVVPQTSNSIALTLNKDNFQTNVTKLADEFKVVVALFGMGQGGESLSEEITITPLNFCEYLESDNGKFNEYQFLRSKNVYGELSQWSVVDSKNIGQSELVVLSEATSGTKDLFEVAEVEWNGSGIRKWRDLRNFVANTTVVDSSFQVAETIATMTNLYNV